MPRQNRVGQRHATPRGRSATGAPNHRDVADAIGGWKPPWQEKQSTALGTNRHGDEPITRPNSADAADRVWWR